MTTLTAPLRRFSQLDIASKAAALSLGANALLMALKITIGLIFGSVAVLGDGVDSAEDLLASGLTLFTVRLAIQPADEQHPYGHGKAESLSALSQAALIAGGAVFIVVTATYRMATGGVEIHLAPSIATMVATVGVNLAVATYSLRAGRISGSVAIKADARHLLTNIVQAIAVIGALALVGITGRHVFDPIVALALAAYLLWIAFGILRDALSELIDTALPDEDVARLQECLRHEGHGVRGYHELRTRKSGRERYIEAHVLIDPALTVSEAHMRMEEIDAHLKEAIPGAVVSIHLDPDEPGIMERGPDGERPAPPTELRLHRH